MNQLRVLKPNRSAVGLPTSVQELEQSFAVVEATFIEIFRHEIGAKSARDGVRDAVSKAKDIIASGKLVELSDKLSLATQPATIEQIAQHLAALVAAFPNAGKTDLAPFGAMLSVDVASKRPTMFALETTCRRLRQTSHYLPTIAQILEALSESEQSVESKRWKLSRFSKYVADAEASLARYDFERAETMTPHPKATELNVLAALKVDSEKDPHS